MKTRLTLIPVSVDTRELLKSLGKKSQTYDDIIRHLIENSQGTGMPQQTQARPTGEGEGGA